jgi:hypothetical protein
MNCSTRTFFRTDKSLLYLEEPREPILLHVPLEINAINEVPIENIRIETSFLTVIFWET